MGMVLSILLVRILGREGFGELAIIQSTIGTLGLLAGLGLGSTATRYTAQLRQKAPERVGQILLLLNGVGLITGLIMASVCLAGAEFIAHRLLERAELTPLVRIASVLLLVSTVDGIQLATIAGFEAFSRSARLSLLTAALSLLLSGPLIYIDGVRGAIVAQVATAAFAATLSAHVAAAEARRQGVSWRPTSSVWAEASVLWRYSLPALGASLMVVPVLWFGQLLLVRSEGGYAELGTVRVLDQLRTMVMYLPAVLLSPTFAIMANLSDRSDQLSHTVRYSLSLSALVVFPAGIVFILLGRWLLPVLYGPEFGTETIPLAWTMIIAGVQATGLGLGNVINATGRMWLGLLINVVWGCFFLVLSIVLVPAFRGVGYLASSGTAYLLLTLGFYAWFKYKEPRMMNGYPLPGVLACYIIMAGAAAWLQSRLDFVGACIASILASGGLFGILFLASRRTNRSGPEDLVRDLRSAES
jgi:O-antigen/teichoic acid export membrane protein